MDLLVEGGLMFEVDGWSSVLYIVVPLTVAVFLVVINVVQRSKDRQDKMYNVSQQERTPRSITQRSSQNVFSSWVGQTSNLCFVFSTQPKKGVLLLLVSSSVAEQTRYLMMISFPCWSPFLIHIMKSSSSSSSLSGCCGCL